MSEKTESATRSDHVADTGKMTDKRITAEAAKMYVDLYHEWALEIIPHAHPGDDEALAEEHERHNVLLAYIAQTDDLLRWRDVQDEPPPLHVPLLVERPNGVLGNVDIDICTEDGFTGGPVTGWRPLGPTT